MFRRGGVFLGLVLVLAGGAVAVPSAYDRFLLMRCERTLDDRRWHDAISSCVAAHERTGSGDAASAAAAAYAAVGKADEAWRLIQLPEAKDRVRAVRTRGSVLLMRGLRTEAQSVLEEASAQAERQGDNNEVAKVSRTLARLHWEAGRYLVAYEAMLRSQSAAQAAKDAQMEGLVELGLGDVFRRIGDNRRADAHYQRALLLTKPWPEDHAYAQFKLGVSLLEQDRPEQARPYLETALEGAIAAKTTVLEEAARTRLVHVLVDVGDIAGAQSLLEAEPEEILLRDHTYRARAASVALAAENLPEALRILEDESHLSDWPEDQLDFWTLKGEVLDRLGRSVEAVAALERAVAAVEAVIAQAPEHQGWLAARRREPFDKLFLLALERGDHALAWKTVARYAKAEALELSPGDTGTVADDDVRERIAAAEYVKANWTEFADSKDPAEPAQTAQNAQDLLVLHEVEGRLWVGSRRDGAAHFAEVGLDALDEDLHRLLGDPSDAAASDRLGNAIWRAAALRPGETPLYVATTGRLRRLALAALRHDGRYWMSLRPLARVPTLSGPVQDTLGFDGPPVILGDATSDLPHARREVQWVAARLGTTAQVGTAVTRDRLLAGSGSALLHVASHAEVGLEGGRLKLADGSVTAHDILKARARARLVVLASCASSVGREVAGSDSLATTFLRAGSGAVLATVRSVPDDASFELVQAFYEEGGLEQPVRALARAQTRLAEKWPVPVWSAFVIHVGNGS